MLSEQFVYGLTISWIKRPNEDEFLLQMEDEATVSGRGGLPSSGFSVFDCCFRGVRMVFRFTWNLMLMLFESKNVFFFFLAL